MTTHPALARRLGTFDAVTFGVASMVGAGVFAVFAPAAAAAGSGLLLALGVAAMIALANALSSAQLAVRYPESGGTYVYGREVLGEWWGYLAGWSFVVGKTASCAAMAMVFAAYAVPSEWQKPVAVSAVVVLGAISMLGVTRSAKAARILVIGVLAAITVAVAAGFSSAVGGFAEPVGFSGSPYGILQAAGLLFFAFAGYARIATLAEEVREPSRTIPRAMLIALGIVVVVYSLVAGALLTGLGADALATSEAPLADLVARWGWAPPVLQVGAALGTLGALLALLAGVSRTALAMGRRGDLPRMLGHVSTRHSTPLVAELAVAVVVVILVLIADLRFAIGFSSFGVLLYYFVANVSAARQPRAERLYPRAIALFGAVGCVVLAASVPVGSLLVGAAVIAVGVVGRLVVVATVRRRGGGAH